MQLPSAILSIVGLVGSLAWTSLSTANASTIAAWGYGEQGQTAVPAAVAGITAIAAGGLHNLALTSNGQVFCWGDDEFGQAQPPAGISNIVVIAAGHRHSLALQTDGTVIAWGDNASGQCRPPAGLSNVVAVSAGNAHSLALRRDGTVRAWGDDAHGQGRVPAELASVVAIAAGGFHNLTLRGDGTVFAWGHNWFGQASVPTILSNVVAIAAGTFHSLALRADGTVAGWGDNSAGQISPPEGLTNVVAIATGERHSLALRSDGSLVGWGDGSSGQIDIPSNLLHTLAIAAGNYHSVALHTTEPPLPKPLFISPAFAVGAVGQAFDHRVLAANGPVQFAASALPEGLTLDRTGGRISGVPTLAGFATVEVLATNAAGATAQTLRISILPPLPRILSENSIDTYLGLAMAHAIRAENRPTWFSARGLPGGLAINPTNGLLWGVPEQTGSFPVTLLATNQHGATQAQIMILVRSILGWGVNDHGQTNAPMSLDDPVQMEAGLTFSLALTRNRRVVVWGDDTMQSGAPPDLTNAVAVAAGYRHALALRSDGTVVEWSRSAQGETVPSTAPRGLNNVTAIAAGGDHSLALRANGHVVEWDSRAVRVHEDLGEVIAVAAGAYHSLALRRNGTVIAWGDNAYGQTNVPTGLNGVIAVASGGGAFHSLALRQDGSIWSWGDNSFGQTNVPPAASNGVAIAAGVGHSLVLRADGTVLAWGYSGNGQGEVGPGLRDAIGIAAGEYHNLVLLGGLTDGLPRWAGSLVALGTLDMPFHFRLTSLGNVTAYGASGLPMGLTLDPGLGMVTGAPQQAGEWEVTLHLTNAVGVAHVPLRFSVALPTPTISSPARVQAAVGTRMVYELRANNEPEGFAFRQLPEWLSWDSVAATLTGTPPAPGDFEIILVATNRFGSGEASLLIQARSVMVWGNHRSGEHEVPATLEEPIAIAAGQYHALAVDGTGRVMAWGDNTFRQCEVPANLTSAVAVAAGYQHSLALCTDQVVRAWGANLAGQAQVPVDLTHAIAVAAGWYHSLALRADGTVTAWGDPRDGQTAVPADLVQVTAIAAGGLFSLALRADGTVIGWGRTTIPLGLSNAVAIAAGDDHALALRRDGTVIAWGADASGQATVPAGLSQIVAIAAGTDHSLALKADGTMVGWGGNAYGQSEPPSVQARSLLIAAGNGFSLAVPDARLGDQKPRFLSPLLTRGVVARPFFHRVVAGNSTPGYDAPNLPSGLAIDAATGFIQGQPEVAGDYQVTLLATNAAGTAQGSLRLFIGVPAPVVTGERLAQAYPGVPFVYRPQALDAQSLEILDLPSWLRWDAGQSALVGVPEFYGAYAATVSASNVYGRGLAEVGIRVQPVSAWGRSSEGQAMVPMELSNVVAIAAGYQHSLALIRDGRVRAWGGEAAGTAVAEALSNVVSVAAGPYHNLALRADGQVIAWGSDWFGAPYVPATLKDVVAIAAGYGHNLALLADGRLFAWGDNWHGQAVIPSGLSNVVAIAAGSSHSLALKDDGSVVAWGDNTFGQTNVPPNLTDGVAIAASGFHSLMLRSDGTVVAWGDNSQGQTNVPAGLTQVVEVAANGLHSLALRADGSVVAWGGNSLGESTPPTGLTQVVSIAAGTQHSLALIGNEPGIAEPIFIGPRYALGAKDRPFRYRAVAKNQPTSYGAQGLPPGLSMDPVTGVIRGVSEESGIYDVTLLAANAAGESREALRLRINGPPGIRNAFVDQAVIIGSDVTFRVDASGVPPLEYQWRKNGENIPGATNASLTLTQVEVEDGGSYSVVVANPYGAVASGPAVLVVFVPMSAPPEDLFANRRPLAGLRGITSGTNLLATRELGEPYHAGKSGSNSVWFTWQAPTNGIATFRTTGSTFDTLLAIYQGQDVRALTLVAQDEDRGGYFASEARFNARAGQHYEVAVDGFAGEQGRFVLEWELEVTHEVLPVITRQPTYATVPAGLPASFQVSASGSNLTYQWFFGNEPIPGAVGPVLTLPNVQRPHIGYYRVSITNEFGRGVESLLAGLEIGPAAGVFSVDKFEDMFALAGPQARLLGEGRGRPLAAGAGGFGLSVTLGWMASPLFSTAASTTQARETNGLVTIGGSSRWFTVVAEGEGTMVFDTTGSDFDTVLTIFRGPATSLLTMALLATDDNGAADGLRSRALLSATNGSIFYVRVDGRGGSSGIAQLNAALGIAPSLRTPGVQDLVIQAGEALALEVQPQGEPPPRVQWLKDGAPMPGANQASLNLPSLGIWDTGEYDVLLSNFVASVIIPVARLRTDDTLVSLAASRFDFGLEGWSGGGSGIRLMATDEGGNPGRGLGVIREAVGAGLLSGLWELRWPSAFLGNKRSAYGGLLQFDLNQNRDWPGPRAAVITMTGGGIVIARAVARKPGMNWITYQIVLHELAGWRMGSAEGPPASRADMLAVLGSLSSILFHKGTLYESEGPLLDNVELLVVREWPELLLQASLASPDNLQLQWPGLPAGLELESAADLGDPGWLKVSAQGAFYDAQTHQFRVVVPIAESLQFFRLSGD